MNENTTGLRWWLGYRWWLLTQCYPSRVRWWWHETLPRHVANLLPRKVALLAFVRVYAVLGECGPDYRLACDVWEAQSRKPSSLQPGTRR